MLTKIAGGVWMHASEFLQSNAVVVQGREGVLLIDPGITRDELTSIADDLRALGQPVVAGFATHPDWDHTLWHASFGAVPRYGTARGAASIREFIAKPDWRDEIVPYLPPEHVEEIPLELLGEIDGLPLDAARIPWHGPTIRIIEHQAHAQGHAALLVEDAGVLVAGDMVSDILIPFPDLDAADPVGDYLAALDLLEGVADAVELVIPGHGSVGDRAALRERVALDRAYMEALRDGRPFDDPRLGPDAPMEWLNGVAQWQVQRLSGA